MRRLLVALLLAPAPALAASEGGAGFIFWEVANIILLAVVLFFAARKPVGAYLKSRRDEISGNIASSEELLSEAQQRLEQWTERANQLESEIASIKEAARKSGEAERAKIIAEAEGTAERIKQGAGGLVERELTMARAALRREAAELSVELASTLLRNEVNEEDRGRLFDEFVEKIDRGEAH